MKAQGIADLYSDYLLASFGATTATGLSELLEGEISHDQVTPGATGSKPPVQGNSPADQLPVAHLPAKPPGGETFSSP